MASKMADIFEVSHISGFRHDRNANKVSNWARGFRFNHYLDAKMKIFTIYFYLSNIIFFNLHFDLLTVYKLYFFFQRETVKWHYASYVKMLWEAIMSVLETGGEGHLWQ